MTAWSSHPVPVARAAAMRQWIDSGEYGRVLAGNYPRRDDDGTASVSDEIRAAAAAYREDFGRSQDPLIGLLRRLGDGAADVGEWVGGTAGRARAWMGAAGEAAARAARSGARDSPEPGDTATDPGEGANGGSR
jgi:hypothetical protein